MTLTRASALFAAAALSACAQTPSVRFGLIRGIDVTETRRIPYVVGTHYGFRVDYRDTGHPITLREQFDLPAPAHSRSSSPPEQPMTSSHGGRTLTREVQLGSRTVSPPEVHSLYVEDIQIARGDPKGQYALKLWLDDRPFKDFQFYIE
jgi:hypothetical protein